MNCHFVHVEKSKAHKAKAANPVHPSLQLADYWPVGVIDICISYLIVSICRR